MEFRCYKLEWLKYIFCKYIVLSLIFPLIGSSCLLVFAGFLRVSELIYIERSDIIFESCYVSIFIPKSKTDIYRDWNTVAISRTDNNLCPVTNLETYLLWANISPNSDEFIFRNLIKCKDRFEFRKQNRPLSYTRMREVFIDAFKPFVSDIKKYGLHSLRSGDVTIAVNLGISDRLFKKNGRWRSETAKNGYVKD